MYTVYSITLSLSWYAKVFIVDGEPALAVNDPERLVVIPIAGVTPVKFDPSIAGKVAGNLASGIVPDAKSDASRFVRLAPLIAGRVPVIFAAGMFVKFAALIAGKAPDNFDAVSVDILASATVPFNWPAGMLVSDAPEPLNVDAVTTPAIETLSKFVWPSTSKSVLRLTFPIKVVTPAIVALSKFVCPSTSKSWVTVVKPAMLTLSRFVWPSTSKSL